MPPAVGAPDADPLLDVELLEQAAATSARIATLAIPESHLFLDTCSPFRKGLFFTLVYVV